MVLFFMGYTNSSGLSDDPECPSALTVLGGCFEQDCLVPGTCRAGSLNTLGWFAEHARLVR